MTATRPRAAGFTLIEIVLAFAIIAIGTAMAIPAFRGLVEEDELTRATRTVENLFRIARDSAIRGGRSVTVVVDSVSGLVWLDVPPALGEDEWVETPGTGYASGLARPGIVSGPGAAGSLGSGGGVASYGTSLDLPSGVRLQVPTARSRFTFEPDGQAFADHLVLDSALGTRLITLDRWTGDVRVR